ncbi:MAG: inositol monophosphatase family protein [Planctomycetota bacterium]
MNNSMSPLLESVVLLVRRAGAELLRYFRAPVSQLGVAHKGPRDLVTRADNASETVLIDGLRAMFPEDTIVAEESGRLSNENERDAGANPDAATWYIDPLDGTTNFVHFHPVHSISVARYINGIGSLAVVLAPALDECFGAERGRGCFWNGRRVRVAAEVEMRDALLATGFSYARSELGSGGLDCFRVVLERCRDLRRCGSAVLDLAYTAAGIYGGFWEYHLKPHDVAAGALLVAEAGGRVTDVAGGTDFLFGGSIVVGAPFVHSELLEILRRGPGHPGAPR